MFDDQVCAELKEAIQAVLAGHPEVRAVAAAITWRGELNDAAIKHGVWVGVDGAVTRADDVILGVRQTLRIAGEQFARLTELQQALQDKAAATMKEIASGYAKLEAGKSGADQRPVGDGAGEPGGRA